MRQFTPVRQEFKIRFFDEDLGAHSSTVFNAQPIAPREYGRAYVEMPNESTSNNSPDTLAIRIPLQRQVLLR